MTAANQKQMDLILSRQTFRESSLSQVLEVANRLDQRNVEIKDRFDILQQHLTQKVCI